MSLVRFKRGDRILIERQSASDIFLVLKGAIAITWQHDSRHQVLVALLAPGETFGDSSSSMPEMAHGLNGYAFANSLVARIDSARMVEILLGVELRAFKAATEMTVGWSAKALMRYIKMFHMSPRERLVVALIEIGSKFGVRDSRGADPESADDAEGPGRSAGRVAAEDQRILGRAGAIGRGDQPRTPADPGAGQAGSADWQSRAPSPNVTASAFRGQIAQRVRAFQTRTDASMKMLLRIAVAIVVVIVIGFAGLHAFGQRQLQAKEEPRDQSVHHPDLDNRADLLGVEQGFMRGATNFNDPGYRDLPNPAQMQISPAP